MPSRRSSGTSSWELGTKCTTGVAPTSGSTGGQGGAHYVKASRCCLAVVTTSLSRWRECEMPRDGAFGLGEPLGWQRWWSGRIYAGFLTYTLLISRETRCSGPWKPRANSPHDQSISGCRRGRP
jgi:hypothetical protein